MMVTYTHKKRNINGDIQLRLLIDRPPHGALKYGKINKDELGDDAWLPVSPTDYCYYGQVVFDASSIVPTSFENRPYSIRGLYLIAY